MQYSTKYAYVYIEIKFILDNKNYEYVENDVVETMEECIEIDEKLGTEIRKSIFLCNRKKITFFLVVLPANKSLDTSILEKKLGIAPLSFAPAESMEEHLGCLPGSASVMGLINDLDDYVNLRFILRTEMMANFIRINNTELHNFIKSNNVNVSLKSPTNIRIFFLTLWHIF